VLVAETGNGSFGFLPHRLDCVTSLVPSVLVFETGTVGEEYIAINEGVLIKTGLDVLVSVRDAISGKDLGLLHTAVEQEFLSLNEQEQSARSALVKLESGFLRRLVEFQHG